MLAALGLVMGTWGFLFLFAVEDHDVGFIAARYVDGHGEDFAVGGKFDLVSVEGLAVDLVDAFDGVIVDATAGGGVARWHVGPEPG